MKTPSILEIILYIAIGLIVLIYLARGIYKLVDRKKHPDKYKNKEEREQEKLDE